MTSAEWIAKAREQEEKLLSLVGNYHPSAGMQPRHRLPITAAGAEAVCEIVRAKIAAEESANPIQRLKVALALGNIQEVGGLLSDAWFGVPESTSCWQIEGFKEAVDLLDDPPEDLDDLS